MIIPYNSDNNYQVLFSRFKRAAHYIQEHPIILSTMLLDFFATLFANAHTLFRDTIRQLQTPDHMRGRIVSVGQIFFIGGPQLGEIEAGSEIIRFLFTPKILSIAVGCCAHRYSYKPKLISLA